MQGFRHWMRHLHEVYVKINGETRYLWSADDHEGEVLKAYVTVLATKRPDCGSIAGAKAPLAA